MHLNRSCLPTVSLSTVCEVKFTYKLKHIEIELLGVTEPSTGSDVAGVKTHARKDADNNWILNGRFGFSPFNMLD